MQKRFFSILLGAVFLLSGLGIAFAQEFQQEQQLDPAKITDEKLKTFSDAFIDVQDIQEDLNNEVTDLIEQSDFDLERFNLLYSAYLENDEEQLSQLSDNEKKALETLMEKINTLQQEQQQTMIEAVQDNDLSVEDFNILVAAIQQNPELNERFQEIYQDKTKN
ncbi:MAG: DUF4168 domain-containing protein [Bacteroidota bacterium]